MKKFLSILLSLVLPLTLSTPAFAESKADETEGLPAFLSDLMGDDEDVSLSSLIDNLKGLLGSEEVNGEALPAETEDVMKADSIEDFYGSWDMVSAYVVDKEIPLSEFMKDGSSLRLVLSEDGLFTGSEDGLEESGAVLSLEDGVLAVRADGTKIGTIYLTEDGVMFTLFGTLDMNFTETPNFEILDGRWLCADIDGSVTKDTPAELKDDFHIFVNKDWFVNTPIPAGRRGYGAVEEMNQILDEQQIALIKDESLTGHDAELVHKLYRLVSDWDYRNSLGVEPAMNWKNAIMSIDSLDALMSYIHSDANLSRYVPFQPAVGADMLDPSVYITIIAAHPLMLKDAEEYTNRTEAGEFYYEMNRETSNYILQRLGLSEKEAVAAFENAIALETLLAAHIRPQSAQYSPDYLESLLNYYDRDQLAKLAGDFPILDMLDAVGYGKGEKFQVHEPEAISCLQDIFTEENVPLIRDWLLVNSMLNAATLLDQEAYKTVTAIENEMQGITGEASDESNAVQTVKELLSVPMNKLYIQNYCTEKQRETILGIVDEIRTAYYSVLESADWLSDETRAGAIDKLDNLRIRAIYPDELPDWSDLDFAGVEEHGSLLEAEMAITRYSMSNNAAKADTVVDMDAWDLEMLPTVTANAAYNAQDNSINIYAGFLGGVFYGDDRSYEQNLGGIGFFIGHEIGHAFDTDGAQYDKNGAFSDWWAKEDKTAFKERAAKLAAWYDGFIPFEGCEYNGQQVQTEAIADMGSMRCLLAIAAQKENFDYDAFFRQFASILRTKAVMPAIVANTAVDIHPMRYMRTNATLAQFQEFYDFYGIKEGDGMYIAPEERVAVW